MPKLRIEYIIVNIIFAFSMFYTLASFSGQTRPFINLLNHFTSGSHPSAIEK